MSLKRRFFRRILQAPAARELLMNALAVGERDSAVDLDRIAGHIEDPVLALKVLRHFGEENKHATLFRKRHESLGFELKPQPSDLDYETIVQKFSMGTPKSRIDDPAPFTTGDLIVFFCGAKAGEERACKEMKGLIEGLQDDPETVAVLEEIHGDEVRHVSYATEELARIAADGHRTEVVRQLRRARRAEARANRVLSVAFMERLMTILGVGRLIRFFARLGLEAEFLLRTAFPGGLDEPILRDAMSGPGGRVPNPALARSITGSAG